MSRFMRTFASKSFTAVRNKTVFASLLPRASVTHARKRSFFYSSTSHGGLSRRTNSLGLTSRHPSLSHGPVHPYNGQNRTMFIQVQSTPNPSSLMFFPGKPVMEIGSSDFPNARVAMSSSLATSLFSIDGVTRVFFGSDFVTVTKSDDVSWDILKPDIFAAIMDFYASGKPLFKDAVTTSADTVILEEDDETVAMIKELLETRIRPAVQDDGGDIEYREYNVDTGIVKLKMQGACSGCPSSAVTLKTGIENMLMHYIPEIKGVEEAHDSDLDEEESLDAGKGSQ